MKFDTAVAYHYCSWHVSLPLVRSLSRIEVFPESPLSLAAPAAALGVGEAVAG